MSDRIKKVIAEWDEISDSDWYMGYRNKKVIKKILDDPSSVFHKTTWTMIQKEFPSLKDVKICVPSSGDNRAVFAFSALGAKVTSCDICERQLTYANEIAKKNSLDIEFVIEDSMKLTDIKPGEYDFVYTSEGVHVWVNDLYAMYQSIYRILKKGGVYINFEIHPFTRPFIYEEEQIKRKSITIQKPYEMTGPFDEGMTFHWRLQDILNAVSDAGFIIRRLEEMHDDKDKGHFWFYEIDRERMSQEEIDAYYDYMKNPLAALPQWFSLYARK